MNYRPQRFEAPDGTPMVVLRAIDYERLCEDIDDARDVAAAEAVLRDIDNGAGTVPHEVVVSILDDVHPVKAWRLYRGLTQVALARAAALSQVWVGRIENGGGYGSPRTRAALAKALDAPDWSLDAETHGEMPATQTKPTTKSARIRELLADGKSRSEVAKLVGVRYQFVRNVDVARRSV